MDCHHVQITIVLLGFLPIEFEEAWTKLSSTQDFGGCEHLAITMFYGIPPSKSLHKYDVWLYPTCKNLGGYDIVNFKSSLEYTWYCPSIIRIMRVSVHV